jgi:hypothetical protein
MNTSVSSEQEIASKVANGTRKTVLKNEGPPKTRLTRRERIENRNTNTTEMKKIMIRGTLVQNVKVLLNPRLNQKEKSLMN